MDLPLATHRSLIEPLTGNTHVKLMLIKRFLNFMDKIKTPGKTALNMLRLEAMSDVRSVAGPNYRNIMLLLGKTSVMDIETTDHQNLAYKQVDMKDRWKISCIKEMVDIKAGVIEVPGLYNTELESAQSVPSIHTF